MQQPATVESGDPDGKFPTMPKKMLNQFLAGVLLSTLCLVGAFVWSVNVNDYPITTVVIGEGDGETTHFEAHDLPRPWKKCKAFIDFETGDESFDYGNWINCGESRQFGDESIGRVALVNYSEDGTSVTVEHHAAMADGLDIIIEIDEEPLGGSRWVPRLLTFTPVLGLLILTGAAAVSQFKGNDLRLFLIGLVVGLPVTLVVLTIISFALLIIEGGPLFE